MGSYIIKLTQGGQPLQDWCIRIQGVGEELTNGRGVASIELQAGRTRLTRGPRLAAAQRKAAGQVTDMAYRKFIEIGSSDPIDQANTQIGTWAMLAEDVETELAV